MERKLKYDVVVIGGGAAGISAAIGAKKRGQSVVLIERSSCLGGQATNANVASYCGFFTSGSEPKQIIGGVGQMVLDKLAAIGKYDGYRLSTVGNAIVPLDSEALKFVLDELVLENEIPTLLYCTLIKAKTENSKITMIECVDAVSYTHLTVKKVFWYVIVGVGIGALIHNWIPAEIIQKILGTNNPFSVLIATIIGIPMYADIFGTIPIAEALFAKGVGVGTILSFMMGVTALSLPSIIMLKKVVQNKLLINFVGIVAAGIIIIGYAFNAFSYLFI